MSIRTDILALNGGHDASATFVDKNGDLRVIEYERHCKKRYGIYTSDHDNSRLGTSSNARNKFLNYIRDNIIESPKHFIHSELEDLDVKEVIEIFPSLLMEYTMGHHRSHNYGSFCMSGFDEALCISLDGGGIDYVDDTGEMTTWICAIYEATGGEFNEILSTNDPSLGSKTDTINFNPGIYGIFGEFVSTIGKGSTDVSNSDKYPLAHAGKMMGLAAYGEVREEWINPLRNFYLRHPFDFNETDDYPIIGGYALHVLMSEMGVHLTTDCFDGKDGYDLAATNQYVFEELCFEFVKPFIEKYNKDVVFSGGCALNVLFNQKLKEYLTDIGLRLYVPPFPNDCGLSFGHYAHFQKLTKFDPGPYCGIEILDEKDIDTYLEGRDVYTYTPQLVVDLIKQGKIGALMNRYSEVGPRALGNRSIICDPSYPDMKDILNSKVKFREWFRPFAPVCLLEDKDLYFEKVFPTEYMSYAPIVRECWRKRLPAITHIDNTTRLQTVTKEQHKEFYEILFEMKRRNIPSVILNTSFNIKGRPILTTLEDAFYVLDNTELDFLITGTHLILK